MTDAAIQLIDAEELRAKLQLTPDAQIAAALAYYDSLAAQGEIPALYFEDGCLVVGTLSLKPSSSS